MPDVLDMLRFVPADDYPDFRITDRAREINFWATSPLMFALPSERI